MSKTALAAALAAALTLPLAAGAQEAKPATLTLEQAIVQALKTNLDVAVQVYDPGIAQAALGTARETFLPLLSFDYSRNHVEEPSTWWISGAVTNIQKTGQYGVNVRQQLPTGGTLTLGLAGNTSESNQLFSLINPYYRSNLQFQLTQPLLKGFGLRTSRHQILLARNSVDLSETQLKRAAIDAVFSVQQAYWNLVSAVQTLDVRRQSLKLGQDLLAKTRREVEVGQQAPIELLNAQAAVAQREADIIAAEAQVRRAEETLARPDDPDAGHLGARAAALPK